MFCPMPSPKPRFGEPCPVVTVWRMLCGYTTCRGVLGMFDCAEEPEGRYVLGLSAAYIRATSASNTWRIGRHAARRHNFTPRRPRHSGDSSEARAYRTRDGELILPGGSSVSEVLESRKRIGKPRDPFARYDPLGSHGVFEDVALGATVTIECSRCHALSHFVVRPSIEIFEEEVKRFSARHPA